MPKIFLTGSAGFIGSLLNNQLYELGYKVETDMRKFHLYRYDMVIHLAAKTSIATDFDPDIYFSNIILAKEIMSVSAPVIYASSCSARHLTNPYAYSKRFLEHLGTMHGNALGMRFFNVYGPNNSKGIVNYLMSAKSTHIPIRGPQLVRDYIHVIDVVREITDAVQKGFQPGIVDVGTGIGTKTVALVRLFSQLSGRVFVPMPCEPGKHEPCEMIAEPRQMVWNRISLEEGLTNVIRYGS